MFCEKVGCADVASHDFKESNSLYATVQIKKQLCATFENKGTSSLVKDWDQCVTSGELLESSFSTHELVDSYIHTQDLFCKATETEYDTHLFIKWADFYAKF